MIGAALVTEHSDLAEWLWLIAAVLFAVAGVLRLLARPPDPATPANTAYYSDIARDALVPIGLALLAIGWLVI